MDDKNQYGTLAIQKELLTLLEEFDGFCQANRIEYSISSGTLLGAVRHQGFIPWDDDLDCIMDRENSERFREEFNKQAILRIESVTESSLWVERVHLSDSQFPSGKTPSLDLFIFDNCPNNRLFASVKLLFIKTLQGMMKPRANLERGNMFLKFCSFVTFLMGRLFPQGVKFEWYRRVSQWGNNRASEYYKIYNDQYKGLRCRYPKTVLEGTIRMPFENLRVSGLRHYDDYLRIIYGDNYMVPPKEVERVPQHL